MKSLRQHPQEGHNFRECVEYLEASMPNNATVRALSSNISDEDEVPEGAMADYIKAVKANSGDHDPIHALADLLARQFHMKKFVPVETSARHCNIAAVLYAGDGIIVKITENSYLPFFVRPMEGAFTPIPGVLPPIHSEPVGKFKLEIFPYISTESITTKDVERMRRTLAEYHLGFREGDARPDNIGRLPDGSLAVLDNDAVIPLEGQPLETKDAHRWMEHVRAAFRPLYTAPRLNGHEMRLVGDQPDFEGKFSPLINGHAAALRSATKPGGPAGRSA